LKPLHASSIGKALLSALPEAEREAAVARLPLDARTDATIVNRGALLADLAHCAARDFAETRGENIPDVMALARPVRLRGDLYAIAVAGPMHRMIAEVDGHRRHLAETCAAIEAAP
jgi:DNA-binding IclR family transcriptional regulator